MRFLLSLLVVCALPGQEPPELRLVPEIAAHSEMVQNLAELCDGIGPRLTGSNRLRGAQAWAMAKLRAYGASNVHEEAYTLGRPWHRGIARARLLNAGGQTLRLAQLGWTNGTKGTVRGEVVLLATPTLAQFEAAAPRLAGKVVLFSSEEQGLLGSQAYLEAHTSEISNIQAVLVMDGGSGRVTAFADGEVDAWAEALQKALAPAQAVGPVDVAYAQARGSDHETFRQAGLPSFIPRQDSLDYWSHTQHTELDTPDHIVKADLEQAAQVMALAAWGLLNGERLGHM